ncbi:DUF429 domain-containing protein [Jatrophihabitans endophyticus]|uniref:DUF429 domain-containing protein n=1 Tax=Jatrophihabitans endophyticus TaxID=1206085 RepID=UPI000933F80C|nr:DUF429 domain-containing protein [Jatrophihabitans endophyticus]
MDGWKRGWVAAVADGRSLAWTAHATFADLLDVHGTSTVAVDMPIATTDGPREVDVAGQRWLREHGGSWSSIFLAPTTATVAAWEGDPNHSHAAAMAAKGDAPGTSIQAWYLIPKMVEVRDALATRPDARVVEAHPECSFRMMDDRIGRTSKKTGRGAGLRIRALAREFDLDLADAPADVPVDDVLDAAAVAWTAARVERGEHVTLPEGATRAPRIVI